MLQAPDVTRDAASSDDHRTRIARAITRHLGPSAALTDIIPLTGGANAAMHTLDVVTNDGPVRLVLRCAPTGEGFALDVPKHVEAQVQSIAHTQGVPAARVAFVLDDADALGSGYVMTHLPGETNPLRVLADAALRARLAVHAGEVLAAIHRIPIATLPALPSASPALQLRALRDAYDGFDAPSAVFEVAFARLARTTPPERAQTLVHGDFRTGNLLVDADGIRAVLDWELCHLGSPTEDLGWCCVNAWRFGRIHDRVGGFGSVATLREAYVAAGGTDFTDEELDYWEIYGTLRWGVICLYQVFAHLRGAIRSIERAAIGRRVSEVELDLLRLLDGGSAHAAR
jgi:aminoglycoside phosphotransferase (APT) family kinase protein